MDTIESPMVAENKIVFSDRNLMMVVGAKYKTTRKTYEKKDPMSEIQLTLERVPASQVKE